MENSPAKRGHTPPGGATTFDLFSWSEGPPDASSLSPSLRSSGSGRCSPLPADAIEAALGNDASPMARPAVRMHQPAGGVCSIKFGEELSAEEAEALLKRKPLSDTKKREMFGSGIMSDDCANGAAFERRSIRTQQPAGGASQIHFGEEDSTVSPKKPTSIPEVAKQKELSGTVETTADLQLGRSHSCAKAKELVGSNIFGPPPVLPPKSLHRNLEPPSSSCSCSCSCSSSCCLVAPEQVHSCSKEPVKPVVAAEPAPRSLRTSVKVSNPAGGRSQILFGQETPEMVARKVHGQKMAELSGNNIFRDEAPASAEKPLSVAKLREMSGSDIFADDKPAGRDCLGGIRKPPGGESSIALI